MKCTVSGEVGLVLSSEDSPSRTGLSQEHGQRGPHHCGSFTRCKLSILYVHTVFFFLSLSPPGWPKTHQVAEDDFELLILLLPPPVLGCGCMQPCLVLWAAGESKRGLGACQVHTPNNGDKAPACVYASEPDSGLTVPGLPRPHPWVFPLTGSRWGKLRRLKSLTQIKTRERIKTL